MDYFTSSNFRYCLPLYTIKMKHFLFVLFLINAIIGTSQSRFGDDKSPLQTAIESKDLAKVKALVAKGADVNEEGRWFDNPIAWAIKSNDISIVSYLLANGANTKRGLEYAIENGNKSMVELLIENNFDLTYSAIYAAEENKLELLKLVVAHGASVKESQKRKKKLFSKYYVTAIEFATQHKNTDMALFLLEKGVTIRSAIDEAMINRHNDLLRKFVDDNKEKNTILIEAMQFSNEEIINYAVQKGADVHQKNKEGQTLLHLAAQTGNLINVARCLDKFNIDINTQSNTNETALMLATKANKMQVVEYLLARNASLDLENVNGETVLFYAARGNSLKTFELLVEKGVDINRKNKDGNTLLIEAIRSNNTLVINFLLDQNVDINEENKDHYTAFQYAIGTVNSSIIERFLEKGADINTKNVTNGTSLMYHAIEKEDLVKITELKNKGADLNALDKRGERPRNDNKEIIMYLVENGVSINAVDSRNDSFLCNAVEDNDLELVHYLISKGADVNQNCYFDEPPLIKAVKKRNMTLVTYLVENKADVNAIGYFNKNVAEYAVKEGDAEITTFLYEHGAMTKADKQVLFEKTMKMESELKSALFDKNENAIVELLKQSEGLPIQSKIMEKIALFSCENGNPIIMALLIEQVSFDFNSPLNYDKQTALFIATINEKPTVVSYLLGKGANKNSVDRSGKTASDYAKGKTLKRLFKE